MIKQMCWLSRVGNAEEQILHLRIASHETWRPYTAFAQYAVPDYPIPGGSKGWATCQKLVQAGWVLVPSPTEKANDSVSQVAVQEQPLVHSASDKQLAGNELPHNF